MTNYLTVGRPSYNLAVIEEVPDLQLEILLFLMQVVDEASHRVLRCYSQTRPLWGRKSGATLITSDRQQNFCRDIISFQVGRLYSHTGITFGNITILRVKVFSARKRFVDNFKLALKHLRIEDLCIFCGRVPSFMGEILTVWSSVLQGLVILRIVFEPVSESFSPNQI